MNLVLKLLIVLLLFAGCKTKHLQIERKEEKHKEIKKIQKDSVFKQEKQGKSTVFQLDNSRSFEIELETEKDSTGQSRTLEFERIRSPSGEKIIVRGGKVKIKTSAKTSEKITKKDTLQLNNTSVRTNIQENKVTESKSFTKQKEVKTQGFTFGGYLSLILWILVLGTLIFLAWRLKLFRKIIAIITKFKRLLKMI
ncbi:hypothetical protein CAPN002_23820 [Capnocytophaga stomatis]|uniref:hypothetical protein n=1 Tax=Capnocytophaga stomatis TaxID=1848904 RepID=UPI00194FFC11|nr:hypothetical protein [Capnocytophaga stomatis]GIJ95164.1 hypothetical protein CAPN002_23820 [Capnocytophaga stomatis]